MTSNENTELNSCEGLFKLKSNQARGNVAYNNWYVGI